MKALWLALLALLLAAAPLRAVAGDDDDSNPHHMSGPDDEESCDFCHEKDMSLSASLLDTCLSCHSLTEHSGSQEHVRASVADVARLQPTPVRAGADPTLPLTPEGTIWCGTCHLYHDPQVERGGAAVRAVAAAHHRHGGRGRRRDRSALGRSGGQVQPAAAGGALRRARQRLAASAGVQRPPVHRVPPLPEKKP